MDPISGGSVQHSAATLRCPVATAETLQYMNIGPQIPIYFILTLHFLLYL